MSSRAGFGTVPYCTLQITDCRSYSTSTVRDGTGLSPDASRTHGLRTCDPARRHARRHARKQAGMQEGRLAGRKGGRLAGKKE